MISWLRTLGALGVWIALTAGAALAHPLGNFTINHLAEVSTSRRAVAIHYTLDIAEIPSFQIMRASGGAWDAAQLRRWALEERSLVAQGLTLTIDGSAAALAAGRPSARLRPGAGGLPTMYWQDTFVVTVPSGDRRIVFADRVYADRRIGWKDVVVGAGSEPTHELTAYPSALIGSPRRNDRASFVLTRDGSPAEVAVGAFAGEPLPSSGNAIVSSGYLSDLFARPDTSVWLVALTVLLAFGLGALHGLEPGHGKALLAFTLVGARATLKQAGILALALTFAHTIAVLLLGLALFFLTDFASESIFGWISLASGVAVAIVGARSLRAALPRAHGRDHDHVHAIPGNDKLQFSSAVIAAMSGGIAPCPAAIVVLLTALRLHRVGYGLALIVVFSLGLAFILTTLGIAVVRGANWLRSRGGFSRFMRYAPLVTSSVISTAGAVMVAQGFAEQGVRVPIPIVALLALAAIAAYAVASHPHPHDHEHDHMHDHNHAHPHAHVHGHGSSQTI